MLKRSGKKIIAGRRAMKVKGNMEQLLSEFWWTFTVRGLVAVLFGLLLILWQGLSLGGLVFAFGFFALLQGILSLLPGVSELGGRIYFLLIEGIVGILAGVLTLLGPRIGSMLWPEIATMTLLGFIIFWALLSGIAEVIGSFRLPREIKGRWLITLSGFVCLLFGLVLVFRSGFGGYGKRFCDWTLCDCPWFSLVIDGLQGSQGEGLC